MNIRYDNTQKVVLGQYQNLFAIGGQGMLEIDLKTLKKSSGLEGYLHHEDYVQSNTRREILRILSENPFFEVTSKRDDFIGIFKRCDLIVYGLDYETTEEKFEIVKDRGFSLKRPDKEFFFDFTGFFKSRAEIYNICQSVCNGDSRYNIKELYTAQMYIQILCNKGMPLKGAVDMAEERFNFPKTYHNL